MEEIVGPTSVEMFIHQIGDEIVFEPFTHDLNNAHFSEAASDAELLLTSNDAGFVGIPPSNVSHPEALDNMSVVDVSNETHIVTETDTDWYCPYRPCSVVLPNCDALTRHILQHHITRVYKCNHCDRLFHKDIERDFHDSTHMDGTNDYQDFVSGPQDEFPSLLSSKVTTQHQCSYCERIFQRKHLLMRHVKTHVKPFKCQFCHKTHVSEKSLRSHILTHNDDHFNKCKECEFVSSDPVLLSEHMLSHSGENSFKCLHCHAKCPTKSALRVHVFYKHFDEFTDCIYYSCPITSRNFSVRRRDAVKYACKQCRRPFAMKTHLTKHDLRKCIVDNVFCCNKCDRKFWCLEEKSRHEEICSRYVYKKCLTPGRQFAHRCTVCNTRFGKLYQLTRHVLTHNRPYECYICNKTFITETACNTHIVTHITNDLTCITCGKTYRNLSQYNDHKFSHLPSNPFACRYCNKVYSTRNPLRRHVFYKHFDGTRDIPYFTCPKSGKEQFLFSQDIARHMCVACYKPFSSRAELETHCREFHSTNPRPFICEQCGAGFPNKTRLRLHVQSHEKTRNFQCTECGIKCTTRSSLTSHMVVHSNEKPFVCEHCFKSFARLIQLKRHVLTHTREKNHQCDICGKMFATVSDVKKHSAVHQKHRSRPYVCELCQKRFISKTNLTTHMKNHLRKMEHVPLPTILQQIK